MPEEQKGTCVFVVGRNSGDVSYVNVSIDEPIKEEK